MLEVLAKWNRWGSGRLPGGITREITPLLLQKTLHRKEIIALIGMRRAGKSTILYQIMNALEARHLTPKACLHINLEEPKFAPHLTVTLLDELYDLYRKTVYPEGKAYLFIDEIQNVPGWERWVRARNETEEVKIFISGSSSKLLSQELATVLTGRHLSFTVFPLNFKEFLRFNNIDLPDLSLPIAAPPKIYRALDQYLLWGGLPEIVLAAHDEERELLLTQYLDDILFKDVSLRYAVRDTLALRNIAIYLLTQTSSLISFQRLSNQFEVSLDLAKAYFSHLEQAFLVYSLPYYSLKASERVRHPQKIHAVDLGFREITQISASPDYGKLTETVVHNYLRQKNAELYYWKSKGELDLLVREGIHVKHLMQVVYDGLDHIKTRDRELAVFAEAKKQFPKAESWIVTQHMPKNPLPPSIRVMPLWLFLLSEWN